MSGSSRDSDKLLLKYGPEEQWSPALVYSGYGGTFVGVKEVKINTSIKNNKYTFTANINIIHNMSVNVLRIAVLCAGTEAVRTPIIRPPFTP